MKVVLKPKLDKFAKLMRDIRITRSLLLKDMADKLDISSAELSSIETGKKSIPDWFIPAIEKNYDIGKGCADMLRLFASERAKLEKGLWCEWQGKDDEGIFCTAHIHEDRVFNCPYKNPEDRLKAQYPCSDYKEIGKL